MRRAAFVLLAVLALVFAAGDALAETVKYSEYEREIIARELTRRGLEAEPEPQGKLIVGIESARLDVLDETDPVPDFFNVFHVTTREGVILQELLFARGERFDWRKIDETARNLRQLPQLSLVLFVPAKDKHTGRVRVLVITKDVWSLRPNWNIKFGAEGLTYFYLNPSEWNLFGTHSILGATFELNRSTWSPGVRLSHNRIFGSRLSGELTAGGYINRATGHDEGAFGTFRYELPRYAEAQPFLYGVYATLSDRFVRVSKENDQGLIQTLIYRAELYTEIASVTRSYGVKRKLDITAGVEAERTVNTPRLNASVDPGLARDFLAHDVPLSDTRISPLVIVSAYENRFLKTIEFETLGLQEDIRLGPRFLLKVYPASRAAGSSRDLLGVMGGVSYTLRLRDGLVRAVAQANVQYANDGKHQALTSAALRIATPRLGFGRLVFDGLIEDRPYDYLRRKSAIGGDGRLRGYPAADTEARGSSGFRGNNAVVWNAEFRSAGVNILSAQCGFALFHDMGAAGDHLSELQFKRSAGVGLRILFPEFDRTVFRVDYAFRLNSGEAHWPGQLFFTLGQAFSPPGLGTTDSQTAIRGLMAD